MYLWCVFCVKGTNAWIKRKKAKYHDKILYKHTHCNNSQIDINPPIVKDIDIHKAHKAQGNDYGVPT